MFKLSRSLTTLAVLANVTNAFAYDGPRIDYNFAMQEPKSYEICDKYINDSARHMLSCVKGRDEARRMATRFAGGEGRLEGYLRGYAWGLHKTVKVNSDDATEMAEGARLVSGLNDQLQVGIQAGIKAGQRDGSPLGAQEARNRFHRAVNTSSLPSDRITVPATNYQGEDNAYVRYIGKVPTAEQILREDSNIGELPIFNSYDRTYLGQPERRNAFDYYFGDGTYRFETTRWDRPNEAWNIWVRVPNDARPDFDNINQDAPRTPVTIDPATGRQVGGELITDFKTIWRDAFVSSYAYYANYFFSKSFHENVDMGQLNGEAIGVQVGKRIARTRGLQVAFDAKFKESSQSSYRGSFTEAYTSSFQTTFADYSRNPKLSIELIEVVGADNDGIIQPGERIGVKFKVVNAGGVGTQLNVSLTGDVQDTSVENRLNINALSAREFTTDYIATVDSRLRPRDTARLVLNVNGLQAQYGQTVNQLVEISGQKLSLSINNGTGTITVSATNVSTVTTPGVVSAELKLNGRTTQAIAGNLAAGATQDMLLNFSGLDPLNLIQSKMTAYVSVKHNDKVVESVQLELGSANRDLDLVSYFDAIANSRGFTPAGKTEEDRAVELISTLGQVNAQEVANNDKRGGTNMYRKTPGLTIPGKLAEKFVSSVQNDIAKERYDRLAKILISERKKFKRFLFWAPKQKHYTNLVRTFSKNKKLK
jgi:hypothetical protein